MSLSPSPGWLSASAGPAEGKSSQAAGRSDRPADYSVPDYSGSDCTILFCNWRMGYQVPLGICKRKQQ